MTSLLRLGAVGDDRGAGHPEADHAEVRGRLRAGHLLEEDRLVAVGRAGAAVLLRPGQPGIARVEELAAPLAARLLEPAAPDLVREVLLDPGAQLRAERCLLGRVAQIHAPTLNRKPCQGTMIWRTTSPSASASRDR